MNSEIEEKPGQLVFFLVLRMVWNIWKSLYEPHVVEPEDTLYLYVNTDGAPLTNSGHKSMWPVSCKLHKHPEFPAFLVGVYIGLTKPANSNFLFKEFLLLMD